MELSYQGTFVPRNESSMGGTFVPRNFWPQEWNLHGTVIPSSNIIMSCKLNPLRRRHNLIVYLPTLMM